MQIAIASALIAKTYMNTFYDSQCNLKSRCVLRCTHDDNDKNECACVASKAEVSLQFTTWQIGESFIIHCDKFSPYEHSTLDSVLRFGV